MTDNRFFKFVLFLLVLIGAATLLLGTIGVAFGLVISPPAGVLAPLPLLIFIPMAVGTSRAMRKRRELSIATYIQQAVRLDMPIPRMLSAAAYGEKHAVARRLRDLSESLENGVSLDAALESTVPEMSDRTIGLIGAGQRTGNLSATLSRIVENGRRSVPRDTTSSAFLTTYPIMMTLFICGVLSVILIFVIPKYEQIFKDFGIQLPPATKSMLYLVADLGPLLAIVVAVIALGLLGRALWDMFAPLGPHTGPARAMRFWLMSNIPPMRGVIRNRDLADVFDVLADSAEHGMTIDESLAEALGLHTAHATRQSLIRWHENIYAGMSLVDSARRAGLPGLAVGLLATAQAARDVPAAFRFLGRYYRDKFSRSLIVIRAAFIPVVVFIFAIPVLWIAVSLLAPAIALIEHLSSPAAQHMWRRL